MMYVNRILVIGYGNELHGDDAAGPAVARCVNSWHHRNIRAVSVQHLDPDLVADITRATAVVFVESRPTEPVGDGDAMHVRDLRAGELTNDADPCARDPVSLLVHVDRATGQCPPAWLLTIAGTHFGLGEAMSPCTSAGVYAALEWLKELLKQQMGRFTLEAGRPAVAHAVGALELPG